MRKVITVIAGIFLALTLSACGGSYSAIEEISASVADVTFEGQAERAAKNYVSMMPFSRSGLIEQLEFEGYSSSEASIAVDSLSLDYNEQAYRAAKNYLLMMPFSSSELVEQLEFEGYTQSQAISGVSRIG